MDNITETMMKKLKSVGFSYPDYEHHLNSTMLYSYQGTNYCIGGWWSDEFSETDKIVAKEGLWLPDGAQLLDWLKENEFNVKIDLDSNERYFTIHATDTVNGIQYCGGGLLMSYALYKVIYKICKAGNREYHPPKQLILDILSEDNASD